MAERVVDLVCERLGRRRGRPAAPSELPLAGRRRGRPRRALTATRRSRARGARAALGRLYGVERGAPARTRSGGRRASPAFPGCAAREIEHAVDEEMALTLEDVLERRTRALLFDAGQGLGGVEEVAASGRAAPRLGRDADRPEIDRLPPPGGELEELRMTKIGDALADGARRRPRDGGRRQPAGASRSTTGSSRTCAHRQGRGGAGPACVVHAARAPPRSRPSYVTAQQHGVADRAVRRRLGRARRRRPARRRRS